NTTDAKDEDGNVILDDNGNVKFPAELVDVEDVCKPKKGFEKPLRISWTTLHEVGHGVDDDTGAMDRRGGNGFAGWQYHSFEDVVKIAAEKLPYDPVFLKHLLTDDKPEDVLKPHDATEAQQKKAVAWAKAVRAENQLWMRGADCKTHALGDRVFHEVEN